METREVIGNDVKTANVLNVIGVILKDQADYSGAIDKFTRSLKLYKEIEDKEGEAKTLDYLGHVYNALGDSKNAIEYYSKSLSIGEDIEDKKGQAMSLNGIGNVSSMQGDSIKAIKYYTKSLVLVTDLKDVKKMAVALNNIGSIYLEQSNFSKAKENFTQSLTINTESGKKIGIASSLYYIGDLYFEQGELDSAIFYHTQSLTIREGIADKQGMASSLVALGNIHFIQKNITKAYEFSKRGLTIAQNVGAAIETRDAAELLWEITDQLGKYKESLEMHELFITTRDDILSDENQGASIRQEYQYSYEKQAATDSIQSLEALKVKDARIAAHVAEDKQQAQQTYFLFGGLALAVLFGAFIFNRFRVTSKQKDIIEEKKKEVDLAMIDLNIEKGKSEELLLNILPAEVADELKEKGFAESQLLDLVTVLFTDFKGFTALSELLSPQDLIKEINFCFSAFDHIMEKHNVEKIKTIGDAYMAAGGLPTANQTHAHDVVRAACDIQTFMLNHAEQKKAKNEPYFEIRIGVHTGPVVAGIVGVKKFQYDIWGDTVNTASRMESSGSVGMVNISEDTYEVVKDKKGFEFESRGRIEAKGKGLLEMYFVHRVG